MEEGGAEERIRKYIVCVRMYESAWVYIFINEDDNNNNEREREEGKRGEGG